MSCERDAAQARRASRQLTPGVVSRRYLLEEDEFGREKEAGEERRKTARKSSVFDGLF
ncbi:MAG: hypothetical protein MR562_01290 [Clostridiaceae bacterium]|nr:hypothetical protein [Clostridiaceae bacterium]